MVIIVRYEDEDWHRLDGEGCARARGVLQRQRYEREDVPEDELADFLAEDGGRTCSDCSWPA